MSLINDALKRASQSERSRPKEGSAPGTMLPARAARRSAIPTLAVGAIIIVLTATAGWLAYVSIGARAPATEPAPAPARSPVLPAPSPVAATVVPKAAPAPAAVPTVVMAAAAAALSAAPAVSNTTVASNVPSSPVTPIVPAAPPFPALKLQAILYNRTSPRIIINGETRGENEAIDGVMILKIQPDKVSVRWNGQSRELGLKAP